MVLQSLAGLPLFMAYFCTATIIVAAYLYIYTWITAHNEFELMRNNVPGAAVSLGLSLVGFALPLAAAISHSSNFIDCVIWGVIALIIQVIVYYVARMAIPDMSARIEAGELAPAIWLGLASVTAGVLSSASMTW
jgi:putative membrane protein